MVIVSLMLVLGPISDLVGLTVDIMDNVDTLGEDNDGDCWVL